MRTNSLSLRLTAKNAVHALSRKFGIDIRRHHNWQFGLDVLDDLVRVGLQRSPILIFDVGANRGDFAAEMHKLFGDATIHCFEPDPNMYPKLKNRFSGDRHFITVNSAVGSSSGTVTLNLRAQSEMNSIREAGDSCWSPSIGSCEVALLKLDDYARDNHIGHISLLKCDTQGFDFEVLKGAEALLSNGNVDLILMENIFDDMYLHIERFDVVFTWLANHGFALFSIYNQSHRFNRLSWADMLWIRDTYRTTF
jgi:FkbM family methyltransferase